MHPYLQPQPWWDLQLHVHLKSQFMNTQAVELLSEQNPPVYQWMVGHVQQLQMMLQQQQMQAAAMQGKGPASKPPPEKKEEKKGQDGSALQQAIDSGALQPKDQSDPMQQAIQSGALQPQQPAPPPPQGPSLDDLIDGGYLSPSLGPPE